MLKSMDTEKRGPKTCQNRQNITKTVTKIDPKSIKIEIRFLDGFWDGPGGGARLHDHHFWEPFSTKSRKKGMKKGMQKSMSKKYRKLMPKVTKNDAKIDTKIDQFSSFSENG